MTLKPWMVAVVGALVTLLALIFQEKITKQSTTILQYAKALVFNGLLSFGIAYFLLRVNPANLTTVAGSWTPTTTPSVTGGALPKDILSGSAPF